MTNPSPATLTARAMRKKLTPPEARLWVKLKGLRGAGFAFRRQEPYRGYFLDFACLSRRLCIEVDGSHHHSPDQIRYDQRRDAVLAADGFETLRIPAVDVREDIDGVMTRVKLVLSRRPLRSAQR